VAGSPGGLTLIPVLGRAGQLPPGVPIDELASGDEPVPPLSPAQTTSIDPRARCPWYYQDHRPPDQRRCWRPYQQCELLIATKRQDGSLRASHIS
jgi:hypothetical protein